MKDQELNKDHLIPVDMMSEGYIKRDPGRIYKKKGKSDPYEIFQLDVFLFTLPTVL